MFQHVFETLTDTRVAVKVEAACEVLAKYAPEGAEEALASILAERGWNAEYAAKTLAAIGGENAMSLLNAEVAKGIDTKNLIEGTILYSARGCERIRLDPIVVESTTMEWWMFTTQGSEAYFPHHGCGFSVRPGRSSKVPAYKKSKSWRGFQDCLVAVTRRPDGLLVVTPVVVTRPASV